MSTTRSTRHRRILDMKRGVQIEDVRFPTQGINPPGAASDPDRSTSTGLLLFAAAGQEIITVLAQMPHGWAEGTPIVPHVHWAKSTSASGTVVWKCEYKLWKIGSAIDAAFTTLSTSYEPVLGTPDTNTANQHLLTSFGEMDLPEDFQISDCILFQISRLGDDANDTYGADAVLMEFDMHVSFNTIGSNHPFIKG